MREHSSSTIKIGKCTEADRAEELLAFVHLAFRDLQIDPPSGALRETVADFAHRIRHDIALIAEADGALVGSIFGARKLDCLHVGRLAVRPDWRRRGVASALIDSMKDEAGRLGLGRMTLGARIALQRNVALFQKHGFVIVGSQCHPGFDVPTSYDMELVLPQR